MPLEVDERHGTVSEAFRNALSWPVPTEMAEDPVSSVELGSGRSNAQCHILYCLNL